MIIDGKKVASEIAEEIKEKVAQIKGRKPCLAVVLVGNHPASVVYTTRKRQMCEAAGIRSLKKEFSANISEEALLKEIEALNYDDEVDGILVQLPLPPHINPEKITYYIIPEKDVDGFHPTNMGNLLIGDPKGFYPCTPLGIKVLLERYQIETAGKHAVIIGRSNIVGKPMAAMLVQNKIFGNATVTIAHQQTKNLKELTLLADILIAAIGKPKFITADMVKQGAVIIDVGINKIDDPSKKIGYRIVGDVDFEQVCKKCSFITPVPGGVGPMTIAMLLSNTLLSYEKSHL
ncbi:MAG TPA: bifunctional methylenetetrahydrofolate dehydrogenase/methenyltetrahydrofolate cyclohydrolase FolD [Parachlamydiaceae bacterium]|nr:bifunctional methylenetetrahydrofolate dehydrogenase/methenyltetrahydrofolate cyclohydrolase FolD [Parachlamydiaceae bacterium]